VNSLKDCICSHLHCPNILFVLGYSLSYSFGILKLTCDTLSWFLIPFCIELYSISFLTKAEQIVQYEISWEITAGLLLHHLQGLQAAAFLSFSEGFIKIMKVLFQEQISEGPSLE